LCTQIQELLTFPAVETFYLQPKYSLDELYSAKGRP